MVPKFCKRSKTNLPGKMDLFLNKWKFTQRSNLFQLFIEGQSLATPSQIDQNKIQFNWSFWHPFGIVTHSFLNFLRHILGLFSEVNWKWIKIKKAMTLIWLVLEQFNLTAQSKILRLMPSVEKQTCSSFIRNFESLSMWTLQKNDHILFCFTFVAWDWFVSQKVPVSAEFWEQHTEQTQNFKSGHMSQLISHTSHQGLTSFEKSWLGGKDG